MTNELAAGLELLVVGMGIVFFFLALLVVAVVLMSRVVARFSPEPQISEPEHGMAGDDRRITAAISAAIFQYRAKHGQKD